MLYKSRPVSYYKPFMTGAAMAYTAARSYGRKKVGSRVSQNSGEGIVRRRNVGRSGRSLQMAIKASDPAKHYCNSAAQTMLHGNIYCVVPTAGVLQGTTNTTRVGDEIYLEAIKIKGHFSSAVGSNVYNYRLLIGYTSEEYNRPTVLGSGITSPELFITNSDANWPTAGIVNSKAFTCLYDHTVDINSQLTGVSDIKSYDATVSLKKKFPYQANGSIYGKSQNLIIVVIASVGSGTVGTTAAGDCLLSYDLIFK